MHGEAVSTPSIEPLCPRLSIRRNRHKHREVLTPVDFNKIQTVDCYKTCYTKIRQTFLFAQICLSVQMNSTYLYIWLDEGMAVNTRPTPLTQLQLYMHRQHNYLYISIIDDFFTRQTVISGNVDFPLRSSV